MKKAILSTLLMAAIFVSCEKEDVEPDINSVNPTPTDSTQTTISDTTNNTMDTSNTGVTVFRNNYLRQITGTPQDFELGLIYAQRWFNVYSDSSDTEGVLRFDIRGPFAEKRAILYFSGITSTTKTYNSSIGSSLAIPRIHSGEFLVEKLSFGTNRNYWWSPNKQHTAKLIISGDDVIVEIENFELGGGTGSIGTETFNIKFTIDLADYNALSNNRLKLINFK